MFAAPTAAPEKPQVCPLQSDFWGIFLDNIRVQKASNVPKILKLINRKLLLDSAVFHTAPSISNISLLSASAEGLTGLTWLLMYDWPLTI